MAAGISKNIIVAVITLALALMTLGQSSQAGVLGDLAADLENDLLRVLPRASDQGVFRSTPLSQKVVAITIDDGPDPRFTPKVLDLLKRERIKATFFLVGKNVTQYPELAKREAREGHVLGNHTWDHPVLPQENEAEVLEQLEKCRSAIRNTTGQDTHLFRPPKGLWNGQVFDAAKRLGYKIILWSETLEHQSAVTPESMAKRVVSLVRPGDIMLCHDGRLDRTKSVAALPLVITQLKAEGYRFVTVPELLAMAELAKSQGHPR